MKSSRIHVDRGISIYRRHQVWWIDVYREGHRKRWNLHTRNPDHALAIAREVTLFRHCFFQTFPKRIPGGGAIDT